MNERLMREILNEIAELGLPAGTDLWPEIQARLRSGRRPTARPSLKTNQRRRLLAWAAGGLAALLLAAAVLPSTPQGRAIAQQVLQLFTRIQGRTFPIHEQEYLEITPGPAYVLPVIQVGPRLSSQAPSSLPVVPGCEDPAVSQTYRCQIAAAEQVAGFDALELPADPPAMEFQDIRVGIVDKTVSIYYTGGLGSLVLIQGMGAFPVAGSDWEKVPAEEVQTVQVGEYPGEYVSGGFIVRYPYNQATWEDITAGSGRRALV